MQSKIQSNEEKRRFTRVNSRFSLEVTPSDSGEGTSLNISQSGLLFFHKEELKVGQLLNLTLQVPGFTGTTNVKGKVVRCESAGVGAGYNVAVSYIDLDFNMEMNIKEMLETF